MAQNDLSSQELGYCGDQVRRDDPDRFLASLFAPADRRESLWALLAFNLEVAKTRERVREPMLGQIRLQWWRDAVSEIFAGKPREHAVVTALAKATAAHGLSHAAMEQLIDAREADLSLEPPADLASLEDYAEQSAGPLLALMAQVLGAAPAEDVCRRLAAPQALSGLLLAIPFRGLHGRVDLPADMMAKAGLIPEAVIDPSARAAVADLARQIADRAEARRRAAVIEARAFPKAIRPALLSLTLAKRNLARLSQAGFDPFNPILGRRDGLMSARLWWAMTTGRF
jgi:NADH dehydrogenase [ubiquinone] 1 alpha subcomplex assembly factor 6